MPRLSIIIPVYNEKDTILKVLERIEQVDFPVDREIIIIDDGSTDGTTEMLKKLDNRYRVVFSSSNQGKGVALKQGFSRARGEIIAIQDADLEYDPGDLPKLIRPVLEGKVDVVYGSRFLGQGKHHYGFLYLGNRLVSWLFKLLYGKYVSDPATCFKVFKKEIIDHFSFVSREFEFEIELTAKLLKAGYQILELPINYHSRSFSQGKKLHFRHGLKMAWMAARERFRR